MKTKKLTERVKTIRVEPFDYVVKVVLTNDVQRSAEKHGHPIEQPWYAFHAVVPDKSESLIVLPFDTGVSTVSHESFHCVWAIMHRIGADHENEVMAYTLGYLVREISAFLWPKNVVRHRD